MAKKSLTFRGGIHPAYSKELSKNKQIEECPEPSEVVILLRQHIGSPCNALVKAGDQVKIGQKIGESTGFVCAPVHSSISGTVKKVEEVLSPGGDKCLGIRIESDGKSEVSEEVVPKGDLNNLSPSEILEIIKEAGITGQGGASFPTHVKLVPPANKPIDIMVINGAECEPYLTADHRIMLEHPEEVIYGLRAMMKCAKVEKGIIGVEDNKLDAISALEKAAISYENIEIIPLETKYPQGDEKRIIDATTGRVVPAGGLPMDIGVIVNNSGTAYAVAHAIKTGMPLIERVVTVTGECIKEPKNLMVKVGTSFSHIVENCGGYVGKLNKIVMGGPMMGIAQYTDEVPAIKGTSGILLLSEKESGFHEMEPCIRCSRCIEACPVNLLPNTLGLLSLKERFDDTLNYGLKSCIECGTCSFVCPSKRPLVHAIRVAKKEVANSERKEIK